MLAYIVLLLAVVSRFLPHLFHATAWNFTAIGGGLLFFGSRMRGSDSGPNWLTAARLASAVAVLAATDYYLTVFAFQYPFQLREYIVTWVWYAAVCLIGMEVLQKPTLLRVAAGVFASSTSFFLLSNFLFWIGWPEYPRTLAGLAACYTAAIPFYRNDLVSTAITAGALFGLPALAARMLETIQSARDQPLA